MDLVIQYLPGEAFADVVEWELDDDPVEMTNLNEQRTGVPGVIFISTRQGRHGPRIKWYPGKAGSDQPFLTITLENPPRMLNHGVAPRSATGVVAAAEWAVLNRQALLDFWSGGTSLMFEEFEAFIGSLKKLT